MFLDINFKALFNYIFYIFISIVISLMRAIKIIRLSFKS
jgi:hypothetical protein